MTIPFSHPLKSLKNKTMNGIIVEEKVMAGEKKNGRSTFRGEADGFRGVFRKVFHRRGVPGSIVPGSMAARV
jgi:hypothetical protein